MGRTDFIRGTRSRAPYGYSRQGTPNQSPQTNLLAWTLAILLLSALALVSWLFPAYVFRNPEVPFNYNLLRKLGKLDDIKAFSRESPPRNSGKSGRFYKAVELFEEESGRSAEQLVGINSQQKRLYMQNYQQGEMFGYITGTFEVISTRVLGKDDFFTGFAVLATSVELPNLVLEYLVPLAEVPKDISHKAGTRLTIGSASKSAAILHLDGLSGDRLSVSAVSLNYLPFNFADVTLNAEPPKKLNLRARWPVFAEDAFNG